ncbi:thioredoxin family protein [Clostridium sp. 19966]|uniref:thioredoxin family protein n=1 Tax=Clostridium sp. 19966 TaxID=2768166 RepID=UPI0028E03D83|nr:thioredoxin family protein [Clostridium sp. 19966]MDT8717194.1 thioredoxin family protein [Clostridium sp. 19966]
MKDVLMFVQETCPYCRQALSWVKELKDENPAYNEIAITKIDENIEADLANSYDYYYVPTFYVDGEKLHEGAATKEKIKKVFDNALK